MTLAMALPSALAVACAEPKAPTALEEAVGPWFNFTNGPANPGKSVVVRGTVPVLWIGTDEERDLVSVNGSVPLDPSESFSCGGPPDFDILAFQDVIASESVRSHSVMENPRQHIYPGIDNFFNQPTFCDALTQPRLAAGVGDYFRLTGNCVFGQCDKGADSFGWVAQGTLSDLVNGGLVRYTEEQRSVTAPGTGVFRVVVENIRLTPVGQP
jgi:hypothetical protein